MCGILKLSIFEHFDGKLRRSKSSAIISFDEGLSLSLCLSLSVCVFGQTFSFAQKCQYVLFFAQHTIILFVVHALFASLISRKLFFSTMFMWRFSGSHLSIECFDDKIMSLLIKYTCPKAIKLFTRGLAMNLNFQRKYNHLLLIKWFFW